MSSDFVTEEIIYRHRIVLFSSPKTYHTRVYLQEGWLVDVDTFKARMAVKECTSDNKLMV